MPEPTLEERVAIAAAFYRETLLELLTLGVDPDVLRGALEDTIAARASSADAEREAGLNGNG